MSQRSEKLHRQVAQLRSDVDALQVAWLSQQHCDAVELAAAAERTRQAHRRASEAQRTARAWKLNAILTLILAALIAGVALVISAKATTTEPATPSAVISPLDNGRLPGDDTPAQEPLRLDQAHVLEDVTYYCVLDSVSVTYYCTCQRCCGKAPDHPAYGITASGTRATPYRTVAVDPSVIPLGADVLVDYGDGAGLRRYRAEDTGGAIKGNRIDLCVGSHAEALQLGRRTATVYWVDPEEVV
jgi:3D (Asp-Asp-Asp) domain-containing protein